MAKLDTKYNEDMDKEYDPGSPVDGGTYMTESPLRRTASSLKKCSPVQTTSSAIENPTKGYYSAKQSDTATATQEMARDNCSNTSDDDRLMLNPMFSPIASEPPIKEPSHSPSITSGESTERINKSTENVQRPIK